MDPQRQGSRPLLQRGRLSSVSHASHRRSSSPTPDESCNYHDAGPSNTPTKERERSKSNLSQQRSETSTAPDASDDPKIFAEDVKSNIYEKETGGTRAKIPDEETQNNGVHAVVNNPTGPASASSGSAWKRQKSRWRRNHPAIATQTPRAIEKTKPRHLMLHWKKELVENAERFVLSLNAPAADVKAENSVIWQHSESEDIKLADFELLITQMKSTGLQESEIGLTKRLLKRVKLVSERAFVGGSFLTPTAIRYDMLHDSRYSKDKCCIFLSFPYFAVAKPQKRKNYIKGDSEHPTRTLLQSQYRLNETIERDNSQCIRMLGGETLKSCVKASQADTSHLSRKKTEELIHVPQMWAMILGLDRIVTQGPISDLALQGPAITVKDDTVSNQPQQCSFVRISFTHRGMPEELTYPLDQCASWFGLLNKHQQIRSVLRHGKGKIEPKHYRLRIGENFLEDRTWASAQRLATGEVLNIWMETPKVNVPKVSVQNVNGDTSSDGQQSQNTKEESSIGARQSTGTNSELIRVSPTDVFVLAFLAWRVLDDFGETDDCPIDVKMDRFLNAIYRSLPATCAEGTHDVIAQDTRVLQLAGVGRTVRPKISIMGKTSKNIDDLVYDYHMTYNHDGKEPCVEQLTYWEFRRLFLYFVPGDHHPESAPIQLFWGLLHELIKCGAYLHRLVDMAKEINNWAERLHFGVHYRRSVLAPKKFEDCISDSAILLASMVDALGAIFNMLTEAVCDSRNVPKDVCNKELPLGKRASSYGNETCRLLETARDQLITEATGAVPGENVGPVVTPEAILIILTERLVYSVYGNGSVDVIIILEECLEQLALKVEKHSSRRLLQKINGFQEEVDIVTNVLLQQRRVLLEFRDCLDPAEFKKPTTARKMRHEFEKKSIEKILLHIREQLRYCKELKDRANRLEVQNVHLVETFADDNSRAIFTFTLITIVFLPLSFVAGFFGMNVVGINPTTSTTWHFWAVGLPLTFGIMIICGIVVFEGEDVWFFLADLPRNCRKLFEKEKKKRA